MGSRFSKDVQIKVESFLWLKGKFAIDERRMCKLYDHDFLRDFSSQKEISKSFYRNWATLETVFYLVFLTGLLDCLERIFL